MAHLFFRIPADRRPACDNDDGDRVSPAPRAEWALIELAGDAFDLVGDGAHPVRRSPRSGPACTGSAAVLATLRRAAGDGDTGGWALVCSDRTPVRVNGLRVVAGLRALRHRDEIRLAGGARCYLSLERRAAIEPFPGHDSTTRCARCRDVIEIGDDAVRCPRCGIWHHQSDALPCWTYAEESACPCRHPTDLSSSLTWTPEGL